MKFIKEQFLLYFEIFKATRFLFYISMVSCIFFYTISTEIYYVNNILFYLGLGTPILLGLMTQFFKLLIYITVKLSDDLSLILSYKERDNIINLVEKKRVFISIFLLAFYRFKHRKEII